VQIKKRHFKNERF